MSWETKDKEVKKMYSINLSHDDIQILIKSLAVAEESGVIDYDTVGRLWDYMTAEVEKQRAGTENKKGEAEE
jgi:hypothetical protein